MSNKKIIYCIPGLGIDCRVFGKLNLPSVILKEIDFHSTQPGTSIEEYAAQLAEKISDENPILLGLSMGGIMAIEISRMMPVEKLILISTVKNKKEIPSLLRFIPKVTPSNTKTTQLAIGAGMNLKPFYFNSGNEGRKLFEEMVRDADLNFINWGFKAISKWDFNEEIKTPYFHIHGGNDLIFPVKYIDNANTVKGGTHFMVYNKAELISERIENYLKTS